MGRRRERTGFGRRQVLQLDDSRRDDSPYRGQGGGGGHWPARNEANALSGLMAHYGESEESSEEEEMTPPRTQPPPPPEPEDMDIPEPKERSVSPKPTAKENGFNMKKMGNVSLDIDSKVANFLAEIDALDADSNDIDGEPLPETDQAAEADSAAIGDLDVTPPMPSIPSPPLPDTAQEHSDADSTDSRGSSDDEADDVPQAPIVPVSVWHHCQDENTQYFYYWNTTTNEVTWEIPLEYSQYLLQVKEYEEALARYEVQKTEFEEKRKSRPPKKKKRHKGSSAVQKPSNGRAAEVDPVVEEASTLPAADKKPVKSWLLKKIRETYGSKYDTGDAEDQENDPDVASTHPAEIGPQFPNSEIGPQLPPAEINVQPSSEIGPQLPIRTEIGPQLPARTDIGPQLPENTEIGPQLPARTEIGPQLPPLSEIGPQLPPGLLNTDVAAEIGPQLPMEEDYVEEAMIGPKMPPSLNFGSVPPPAELYGPPDVPHEADTDRGAAADMGPRGSKDGEFPDADSSGYGVAVGDAVISGNGLPQELDNEADATEVYPDPFSAPLLTTVGLDDSPLVFKKQQPVDSDMSEDEDFDLDFIDKQLEEPLESQYVKKKTVTTDEDASHLLKKTDVKVKSIVKNKGSAEINFSSEVKVEAEVNVKAEVEPEVKIAAVEEEDSDMEFDIDDIDQELEAALEKKKAEEKKTIKKEVVASPSKRKLSDDSSSSVGEKPKKARILDKEKSPQPKKKMDKGEIKIKAEVADIATLIMDKLEFLDISRKGLSKLQMLLIEVETRILDWREGALNTQYLLGRLEDAEQQLQQYESSAAPAGWACHWDRTYKRYFYFHLTTGASQWDYPDDDGANKDVTKSDAHSTAAEPPSSAPGEKVEPAQQVSSSQVDGEREEGEPAAPLPQCAQVDSTTVSTDATAALPTVSSSVTSSFNGKTEPPSSSVAESSSASSGASSAFAVDPSFFQDLFAPAPPPPAEPPPPGVEAAPSSLTPPPPRPPPGLATSIPLSRSPPPPPPGTTPPPCAIEEVEMEITGMDATTSSLLAAAPPPPPPLDVVTSASAYPAPTMVEQAPQYPPMVGAPMVLPPMVPPVIMAPPFISNTCTGMPMPVPMPVPQPPGSAATIVAPPVISGSGVAPAPVPPPPAHPPSATPPDTPPRNPVMYDPTLDGVPLVDSSHPAHPQSSTTSPSVSAAAAAQAKAEKKRRKEKKSAMGLSLKKKKLPSLVAKWEAVGRESSKHPKEEDSP